MIDLDVAAEVESLRLFVQWPSQTGGKNSPKAHSSTAQPVKQHIEEECQEQEKSEGGIKWIWELLLLLLWKKSVTNRWRSKGKKTSFMDSADGSGGDPTKCYSPLLVKLVGKQVNQNFRNFLSNFFHQIYEILDFIKFMNKRL